MLNELLSEKPIESIINLKTNYHWFIFLILLLLLLLLMVGKIKIENFMDNNWNEIFSSFVSNNNLIFILLICNLYFQIYKFKFGKILIHI